MISDKVQFSCRYKSSSVVCERSLNKEPINIASQVTVRCVISATFLHKGTNDFAYLYYAEVDNFLSKKKKKKGKENTSCWV